VLADSGVPVLEIWNSFVKHPFLWIKLCPPLKVGVAYEMHSLSQLRVYCTQAFFLFSYSKMINKHNSFLRWFSCSYLIWLLPLQTTLQNLFLLPRCLPSLTSSTVLFPMCTQSLVRCLDLYYCCSLALYNIHFPKHIIFRMTILRVYLSPSWAWTLWGQWLCLTCLICLVHSQTKYEVSTELDVYVGKRWMNMQ
jgi:hypothetical protein